MSESPLAGQTALVTGGARRVGRAIVEALAARGAHVVIHCRHARAEADALAAALRPCGVSAWAVQADLADPAQAGSLFAQAADLAGPVDILVNSASLFPPSRLADFSPEHLAEMVQLHATAPVLLGRALAAQRRPGSIVNITDARSLTDYDPAHVAYHASKRLLDTFTRMMAIEFAPLVRVNAIAPGLVLPPEGARAATLQRIAAASPLQALGSVDDLLRALFYLLESPYVTGQTLYVDGGRHLRGAVYA
jgi:NAD(P)-dependent dehydrogenase (short-subunit alcohol dehydrogenase family)